MKISMFKEEKMQTLIVPITILISVVIGGTILILYINKYNTKKPYQIEYFLYI